MMIEYFIIFIIPYSIILIFVTYKIIREQYEWYLKSLDDRMRISNTQIQAIKYYLEEKIYKDSSEKLERKTNETE